MAYLSFHYGLLSYDDQSANHPTMRNFDISQSFQGLTSNHENSQKCVIAPGQTVTIAATARPLANNGTTGWSLERPVDGDGIVRLRWTGTGAAPQFRVARALGIGPSTQVSIVRVGPATARITFSTGSTAACQVGDILKFFRSTDSFTSPFGPQNAGQSFVIQAVGSGYLDFLDNGSAGIDSNITGADTALAVMSNGPVAVGDTVFIDGSMNSSNKGEFKVNDVAPDFIELLNPYGIEETFTGGTVKVYDHLIQFMHVMATAPIALSFDDAGEMRLGRIGSQALFMGAVNAYQVDAINRSSEPVTVTIRHMAVD